MEENYIMQKLMSYVSEIFSTTKVEDYYGVSRSLKILNHVNDCIILENIRDKNKILSLRCASILHNVDNRDFFSKNNSNSILDFIFGNDPMKLTIQKILKLIHSPEVKISEDKRWMLIPQYAHMLECLGEPGLVRLYFFYYFYNRTIIPNRKTLRNIDYYNSKEFSDNSTYTNLIEQYLSFCRYRRHLEKSNIPYIIKNSRERFEFMRKYLENITDQNFDANYIIKLKRNIIRKKLL